MALAEEQLRMNKSVKLVVQVPCFNEAANLPEVLASIPRQMPGVDKVEVFVIDDGSTDGSDDIARRAGADRIIRHRTNRGLAAVFRSGLDAALRSGADVIVNIDGDGQYDPLEIPRLIAPILSGEAEIVIGDRQASRLPHFSATKRLLQAFGSWFVRRVSGTKVPDAPSGFRAFSREAAMRLNVVSDFSYTLETLIQAGAARLAIAYVPVKARQVRRQSRLFRSIRSYVRQSAGTIMRVYTMYRPLRVFLGVGALVALVGTAGVLRFLWFYVNGSGSGHIQSLVLSGALLGLGFQVMLIGLVADLVAANRRLLEETLYRLRRLEIELGHLPDSPIDRVSALASSERRNPSTPPPARGEAEQIATRDRVDGGWTPH